MKMPEKVKELTKKTSQWRENVNVQCQSKSWLPETTWWNIEIKKKYSCENEII